MLSTYHTRISVLILGLLLSISSEFSVLPNLLHVQSCFLTLSDLQSFDH